MLAHLTDTLTIFITNMYVTLGLAGIVIAMALESCCIPLPSEIVMPLAGVMFVEGKLLAGVNFWLGLVLIALAGAIGCLIGSTAAYGIGYTGGRPLMLKYGRYVLISQHDADMADRFFQKWGGATAFFSRLMPIVRTYISLPAGITKMPFIKFCVYTFLGSFPWCFLLAYVGTVVGNNLSALTPIFRSFEVVIIIALVILLVLYIWRHILNDRKARAEQAAAVQQQQTPQENQWLQQPQWGQQQWGQSQQQIPQGQPMQPQQQWGQPQQAPQWGETQRPSQQEWVQVQSPQQPPWPPQGANNNGFGG
ncbi:MAG TPA: DedA family protein [Ktedonobacteraceae bacterium]|nr:DedA family protein [Ktedonobacteraceae bacterium]